MARPVLARALSTKESGVESGMPAGYGEFLDQMEEKTSKMEASVQALGETNAKREQLHAMSQSVKWMDPEEMEFLFHLAAKKKQELQEHLTDLQRSLAAAKSNFAVDAPDGESDGHIEEEIDTVKQILAEHVAHVEQEKKCAEQRKAPNEWMSGWVSNMWYGCMVYWSMNLS